MDVGKPRSFSSINTENTGIVKIVKQAGDPKISGLEPLLATRLWSLYRTSGEQNYRVKKPQLNCADGVY